MEQAWQSAVQQAMRKELLQLHANNTTTGSHDDDDDDDDSMDPSLPSVP